MISRTLTISCGWSVSNRMRGGSTMLHGDWSDQQITKYIFSKSGQ